MRHTGFSMLALAVLAATALWGCAPQPVTLTQGADRSEADEAAIRRTLSDTEQLINQDDLTFVDVFAQDAVIIAPATANIVGIDAIRAVYAGLLKQAAMSVHFSTEEVAVAGDLAYERGSYTLTLSDRTSGEVLLDAYNKHVHIFKRDPSGDWKTWRMIVTPAEPAPASEQ